MRYRHGRSFVSLFALLCLLLGCGPNETILKSGSNENRSADRPQSSQPAYDSVEAEVENMRTADFEWILVLRRPDGGVMQPDDKAFVRTQLTGANRRSLVDGEKAIVIGSNAKIPPEIYQDLSKRFQITDFSKPDAKEPESSTVNANISR